MASRQDYDLECLVDQITEEICRQLASGQLASNCPDCSSDGEQLCASNCTSKVETLVANGATRIAASSGIGTLRSDLAQMIDHTLLKPEATPAQIEQLCQEAHRYRFASVCINPSYVKFCADILSNSPVKVCTVIGFPLGANTSAVKAYEAKVATAEGATEVDMVIHVGALKAGDLDYVTSDIQAVVQAVPAGVLVKVILETALLNDPEKVAGCEAAVRAGAHFVKTSTGFGPGGATAADIALMRRVVGPAIGVKASGGIRNQQTAQLMVRAGATRIGASASVRIVADKSS